MRKKRRQYTKEFKIEAVHLVVEEGRSISEVARELGIGEKISIRVNGIDTPEIKGKCDKEKYDAKQAKEMVADILKDAEQINLKNMERGKYFRWAWVRFSLGAIDF